MANKKFKIPTSAYKSAWIVKEYKKRGGTYRGVKKDSKLTRWFKENWVNLTRGKTTPCGRHSVDNKGPYPLCRPSKKISKNTPKTINELSRKIILKAKKLKEIYKSKKRVMFL